MGNRHRLRPAIRWAPLWVLRFLHFVIGGPFHIGLHLWIGLKRGVESWWIENCQLRHLDD